MASLDDILLSSGLYEEMFRKWEADPNSVDPSWGKVFQDLEKNKPASSQGSLQGSIESLKEAWRTWGHLQAHFNPLKPEPPEDPRLKDSENETIRRFKRIYGGKIGFEFKGFTTPEIEAWFQSQLESNDFPPPIPIEEKQMILEELSKSELLEHFMHMKYVGQKRFSLEGTETLIPMLQEVIEVSDAEEFVIGMAHRGRLNVLSNLLNKSFKDIFSEFDEAYVPTAFEGTGDVKYHKGFVSERKTKKGRDVKIILTPNPSHLESVDPVVEGQVKGRQVKGKKAIAILIHGDAAITGQGVVYETLQMQGLKGFSVGGTLHFIINNQIGFTTHPSEGRSTLYCTDIAKTFGSPVIHLNVEDPEGCVAAVKLAVNFHQKFKKDIFLDLYGWRKYGHNESDEPTFTQPSLYQRIKGKSAIRDQYRDVLIHGGALEHAIAESIEHEYKKALNEARESAKAISKEPIENGRTLPPYQPYPDKTAVAPDVLKEIARQLAKIPEGFHVHPKVVAIANDRKSMGEEKRIDWGMAEMFTYGSLLWEGRDVRLTGQDVERGTFSHRHAVWIDQQNEDKYYPLAHLKDSQGDFYIYNTLLSEFASLGFEYGYSLSVEEGLTIWEAQYGDFANGAQVIIDQYLASSEQKWGQKSNITLFLPHGYEGQGPEHSSARMERFLSLAGHDNLRICNPSTPHQLFHLLRRQALVEERKPLIVFTPKALLRLPACTSTLQDFSEGTFQEICDDPTPPALILKVVFCTGKIYFELKGHAEKIKDETTAFVRVEQLYPLYVDKIKEILVKYKGARDMIWVQEEPKNMGAGPYMKPILEELAGREILFIGRQEAASPAAGIYLFHKKELHEMMEAVFKKDQPTTYEIAGQVRA